MEKLIRENPPGNKMKTLNLDRKEDVELCQHLRSLHELLIIES